jgi:hypothetical protein
VNNRAVIVGLVLLSLVGLLYFINRDGNKYKWNRTYRLGENEPYDLSIFYETIKTEYGGQFDEIKDNESLTDNTKDINPGNADIYMFVGRNCYLTADEAAVLKDHVFEGGTAFISAAGMPEALLDAFPLLKNTETEVNDYDSFPVVFRHKQANPSRVVFYHYNRLIPESRGWLTFQSFTKPEETDFSPGSEDPTGLAIVSANPQKGPDFICIYHGSGKLFLHANPVMFGNVYQTLPYGRAYLSNVLRHLPGNRVVFDRGAGFPKKDADTSENSNMLDFIKGEPALWYAWQLLLVSVVLFLVFAGRRKQRGIPVIEPPANHTMAFVDAIGRFYKNEKQNALVYQREWNQFVSFLQQQFRFRLKSLNEEELKKLSDKTGVSIKTIEHVVSVHEKYRHHESLSAAELTETNKAIGRFYEEYRKNYGKSGNTKRTAKSA